MELIMAELNQKFSGQAAARLDTYAGKMDLLAAGAENAKETIGKGLLDALSVLSKDDSIQGAIDDMDTFATSIADATYGMALLIKKLDKITGLDKVDTDILMFLAAGPLFGSLAKYGSQERNKPKSNFTYSLGPSATKDIERANKILKERNKLAAEELKNLKAKTEVDKLKDKFDLERIGFTKALNETTDAETKLRLQAKIAILDNNEALAKKILAEMNGVKAVDELSSAMNTAAAMILTAGQKVLLGLGVDPSQMAGSRITGTGGFPNISNLANTSLNNPSFGTSAEAMGLGLALGFTPGGRSNAPQEIVITVDTASGGDRLSQAIAESIQVATRNGYSTVPAGQGF